jgi:hypothetical protein
MPNRKQMTSRVRSVFTIRQWRGVRCCEPSGNECSVIMINMGAVKFSFVRPTTFSDLRCLVFRVVFYLRRLFARRRRSRPSGESPGLSYAGVPVPVGPISPHHLQAAKEFPPSDRTHSFPKD